MPKHKSTSSSSTPRPSAPPSDNQQQQQQQPSDKQLRMREKAEEINLVLLEPDVDLWKLRELALSEGGLVNDTIRRRAWPKLVGLTRSYNDDEQDVHERKIITVSSPPRSNKPTVAASTVAGIGKLPLQVRKGTAPQRVTNFGTGSQDDDNGNISDSDSNNANSSINGSTPIKSNIHQNNNGGTAFTGGPFDHHDTNATAALAEDDTTSLASFDSDTLIPSTVMACQDHEQIERDVTRCTWHLLTGGQRSRRRVMMNKHKKKISKILRHKQRRLGDLINLTLSMSEVDLPPDQRLCYFQGYHDVASIFLAALGGASSKAMQQNNNNNVPSDASMSTTAAAQAASMGLELSSKILYQLSLSHFREPMNTNFLQLQTSMRMVLFPLLRTVDPELHAHLYACGMEPFFALSWLLTWFSHDIRDTALVKRLFDFFICSHPLMPMYLCVAMLCHPSNRQEVLATPCEFAELHQCLAGLPKNSSMVGWKYRVGDGYVSDDDEIGDGDTTSISLDSDMTSHEPGSTRGGGPSLISGEGIMRREDLILSEDHTHVVSMGIPAHVPFQELMDTAVSFMRRVPPRKLLSIASRYFDPLQAEPMLKMYPKISLFQSPPAWSLARTAKADWVLKQRARDSTRNNDRTALSKLRNRHSAKTNGSDNNRKPAAIKQNGKSDLTVDGETCTPEEIEKLAKKLKYPKAMIALGFGLGEDSASRRKKRRKLLAAGGVATVAIIAIAIGVNMSVRRHERLQQIAQLPSTGPGTPAIKMNDIKPTREEVLSFTNSAEAPIQRTAPAKIPKDLPAERKVDRNTTAKVPAALPVDTRVVATLAKVASSHISPSKATVEANIISESLLRAHLKQVAVNRLKDLATKFQLLVRTLGMLKACLCDPALGENILKGISQFKSQTTQRITRITVPRNMSDLRNQTSLAAHNLARCTDQFLKFFLWHARDTLGGIDLEELHLL